MSENAVKKVGAAAAVADLARAGLVDSGPSLDPEQLEAGVEFFRVAEKYLRALHTYDADHPSLLRFLDELEQRLHYYEERYDELQVTLHPTTVAIEGEIVFAAQRVDDNMWFPLFGDGIRQLSFNGSGGRTDMVRFFDIVAELNSNKKINEAGEDDSVTILWEADLAGIAFVATSTFTEGREGDNNPALATVREMINLSMMQELSGMALSGAAYASGDLARRLHSISLSAADLIFLESDNLAGLSELPMRTRDVLGDLYRIDAEQRQEFAASCGIDPMVVERYLHAILAAFAHVMDPVDAAALSIRTKLFLDALIHQGNYKRATDILNRATATQRSRSAENPDPNLAAALELPLLSEAAAGDLMVALRELARTGDADNAATIEQVFELIEATPASSAGTVVRLLEQIDNRDLRRRLCRVLARHGDAILDVAQEVVLLWDEELARDLLDLVGAVSGERATAVLEHALDHPVARVRAQAMTMYLAAVPPSVGSGRAKKALADSEVLIRRVGCHYLARNRPPGAKGWIEERINASSFADLEFAEKKRLYFAYASIGGESIVPWLRQRLRQRNVFGKSSVDHERAAAALTLAQLRCEEAREDIDKLTRGRLTRSMLKEACTEALALLDAPATEFDAAPATSGAAARPKLPPQRTQVEFAKPSPSTASTVVEVGAAVIAPPSTPRPTQVSANPAGMPMVTFRSVSPSPTPEPPAPARPAQPQPTPPRAGLSPASRPGQATEALPGAQPPRAASQPTEAMPAAGSESLADLDLSLLPTLTPTSTPPTPPRDEVVSPPAAATMAISAGKNKAPAWLQPTSLELLDMPASATDVGEELDASEPLSEAAFSPSDALASPDFFDLPTGASNANPLDMQPLPDDFPPLPSDDRAVGAEPASGSPRGPAEESPPQPLTPAPAAEDSADDAGGNVDDLLKNYLDD